MRERIPQKLNFGNEMRNIGASRAYCHPVSEANYQEIETTRICRKLLRGQNNKLGGKNKEKKCEPYAAGFTLLFSRGSTPFFHWQCTVVIDK